MGIANYVLIIFGKETQKYFTFTPVNSFNHESVIVTKKEEAPTSPEGLPCLFNIISIKSKV